MFDLALRLLLLLLCAGAILTSVQVAVWTTKPWWQPLLGTDKETLVTIEPVGMIEGGKLKQVEARPIASQLNHRLATISAALNRDLSAEYNVLRTAGVFIPRTNVEGHEQFRILSDANISFEVEVFKFDIAGLMTAIHQHLDRRDSVKSMIELRENSARVFLDLSRVNGDHQRLILDSGPSLNEAIELCACAIVLGYRRDEEILAGLDAHSFCEFLRSLGELQNFVVQSANRVQRGGQTDFKQAEVLVEALESDRLSSANAPVIHMLLASLYRLQGDHATAVARLERAAALVPDHEFVVANLDTWRQEELARARQREQIAAAKTAPAGSEQLEALYANIRTQSELARIKFPEMLARLEALPPAADVKVAVFSTGFTQPVNPAPLPRVLDALNATAESETEDKNGHGNMVTHLLTALTPREGISVLPVKVLESTGAGGLATILKGFDLAADAGADVFAIPLGGPGSDGTGDLYKRVMDGLDVIAVAAAGNSSQRPDLIGAVAIPAALPRVVSVGGQDPGNNWFSLSPGPEGVDVAAPAQHIVTTLTGLELRTVNGTSFSAIIVSALFALGKSLAPDLDQAELLSLLQETAAPGTADGPSTIDALAFIEAVAARAR